MSDRFDFPSMVLAAQSHVHNHEAKNYLDAIQLMAHDVDPEIRAWAKVWLKNWEKL